MVELSRRGLFRGLGAAGLIALATPAIIRTPKLLMPIKPQVLVAQTIEEAVAPELILAKTYVRVPADAKAALNLMDRLDYTDWKLEKERGVFSRVYLAERGKAMPVPPGTDSWTEWQPERQSTGFSHLKLGLAEAA